MQSILRSNVVWLNGSAWPRNTWFEVAGDLRVLILDGVEITNSGCPRCKCYMASKIPYFASMCVRMSVIGQNPEFVIPNVKILSFKILNVKIPNVKIQNVKILNVKIPNAIRQKIPKIEVYYFGLPKNSKKISKIIWKFQI